MNNFHLPYHLIVKEGIFTAIPETMQDEIPDLEEDEIIVEDLKEYLSQFLKKGKSPEAVIKGNSELKRLIRIYDFVKYHSKMPLTTSSNSANT
jgi:hypothetical protein